MARKEAAMKNNNNMAKRGVVIMLLLLLLGMGICIIRVLYCSVIKGEDYKEIAEAQQLSVTTVNAMRGTIYDCNMNVLAESATVSLVKINPSKVTDENRETLIRGLTDILGVDADELRKEIAENADRSYLSIKGKVELPEKNAILKYAKENDLSGVIGVDPDTKRYYPNSSLASTVLGFTGTDGNGLYGIEYYYDDELTGTNGRKVTAKDGMQVNLDNGFETVYDAQQGTNLVLTIDAEIQTILESALANALEETSASNVYGMVMATKTGAILAEANMPDYDPNDPFTISDSRALEEIDAVTDEDEKAELIGEKRFLQWKNKSIADFYEPGSVFKVFLVSAAMEEGVIDDSTSYFCGGTIDVADRTIKDFTPVGHGFETPRTLLVNSCNTFSVHVGQMLGVNLFYKYFEAFGFTEKTGIDIAGEGVPVAGVTYHSPEISFSVSDLASSSFGQSISVTPLQVITAVSAIGNGGKLMKPYIVAKKLDSAGKVISETEPVEKRQVISEKTAATVASYMEDVVKSGTGTNAYVAGYRVACKTGTSEKLNTDATVYIASTAGFAPVDDPEISVIIIIDEPKGVNYSGGVIAAPVAGVVFEKTLRYLGIEPSFTEQELANLTAPAPSLTGLSISEAESKLRETGFNVRVVGGGSTVVTQSPEAGRTTPGNGVIVLYTEENQESEKVIVPDFSGMSVSMANQIAIANGLNIRISGSTFTNSNVVAYKQDYAAGSETELGTIVTVSFRTTDNVLD